LRVPQTLTPVTTAIMTTDRTDFGDVFRESAGQGSDGAAGDDEEQTPAVKKSGDAAESVADETIEAASFGIGGGELGVG